MAMSHADCDHPRTPAGRAACRKAGGGATTTRDRQRTALEGARKELATTRRRKAVSANVKRPGTRLRTIGDLPDVPRMLAHGCRIAWDYGWNVKVGYDFNDTEKRIVIQGTHAEVALVWRPSLPDGVWGVFVRPWDSSITHRIEAGVDHAMRMAAGHDPLPL